jgi:preprotein translocase subunit SecG
MNWLPIVTNFLSAILVIVSLLIILLVLMQRPKNEGLGAAFGGGMTENLFGAQTTNVLQTATRYLGGLFFALTLLLSWLYVQRSASSSTLQQRLSAPTVIPATPAPVPPAAGVNAPAEVKAPGVGSDAMKVVPPTPAPPVEGATPPAAPAPGTPDAAKAPTTAPEVAAPTPASPEAAKPAPADPVEKPAEKPADKPAN